MSSGAGKQPVGAEKPPAATGKKQGRARTPDKLDLWQHQLPINTKDFGVFQSARLLRTARRSDGTPGFPDPLTAINGWSWFRYITADEGDDKQLCGLGVLLLKDIVGFRKALYSKTSISTSITGQRVKNWALNYMKEHNQEEPFYVLPGVRHLFLDPTDGSMVVGYADILPDNADHPEALAGRLASWAILDGCQHSSAVSQTPVPYEMFPRTKGDPTVLLQGMTLTPNHE